MVVPNNVVFCEDSVRVGMIGRFVQMMRDSVRFLCREDQRSIAA